MNDIRTDWYGNLTTVPAFLDAVDSEEVAGWRIVLSALAVLFGAVGVAALGMLLVIALEALFDAGSLTAFPGVFLDMAADPFQFDASLADDTRFAVQRGVGFGLGAVVCLYLLSRINDRPMLSWITAAPAFRWRLMAGGFLAGCAVFGAAATVKFALAPGAFAFPIFDPSEDITVKALYVAALVFFVLPQAALGEILSRGWLMQTTYAVTDHILPLLTFNALLFAALRGDPDPIANIDYVVTAMVWSWAALRLGGLEFAIGGHTAAVIIASSFITPINARANAVDLNSLWVDIGAGLAVLLVVETLARLRPIRGASGALDAA